MPLDGPAAGLRRLPDTCRGTQALKYMHRPRCRAPWEMDLCAYFKVSCQCVVEAKSLSGLK